ncbi:UNVERIFIED_CONTAM: U-box domain-containing protein 14 [Sesamum latifolium]|uniref:U-box domain-containing protein 14 n=1 Tax=Sesamum latifolium TaxID=2727402 RepID=A0AAW2XWT8_9LAMI
MYCRSGSHPSVSRAAILPDLRTQEHAVTALLNLSINEANKGTIVNAGAIPDIVDVLKNGSTEARENAAATLFSLSVVDENKVAIGAAGAIPPLIDLLCQGTPKRKERCGLQLYLNLSINQGNKVRAVRAGIVPPLMRLLKDPGGGMVDEALAILAIIASHQEGKVAIGQAEPIPTLVEVYKDGLTSESGKCCCNTMVFMHR